MADFSKQWCEANDPEMPGDFDILEQAEFLQPNHYVFVICEGYGFIAIAKDEQGDILLGFNIPEQELVEWVPYSQVVKN